MQPKFMEVLELLHNNFFIGCVSAENNNTVTVNYTNYFYKCSAKYGGKKFLNYY